jgi:dolichol-phosphate mannosyltransferase
MHAAEHSASGEGSSSLPEISVLVPAYDEERTIGEVLRRLRDLPTPHEVIVVDDGSTDRTAEIASRSAEARLIRHDRNRGKGAAFTTALREARAPVVIVQDADLEYDPRDIPRLYERYRRGDVDAVYGSRNLRPNPRSSRLFYLGGVFLSVVTSVLYGARITDEATGYKMVGTELLRSYRLRASGFDLCAELTAAILRRGGRIAEVAITYSPRSRAEGKKITAWDGLVALWVLFRERIRPLPAEGQGSLKRSARRPS